MVAKSSGDVVPLLLETGDNVALQASNCTFLSRIEEYGEYSQPIEANVKHCIDGFCVFTVTVLPDTGLIALKANNGKFLSQIFYGTTKNPIEALKESTDPYCWFTPTMQRDGRLALQASNGYFLSPIERDNKYPIEADKDTAAFDDLCKFWLYVIETL